MLVSLDSGQLEWRVASFLSQDSVMISEIVNGEDAHAKAVTEIMELPLTDDNRTTAKITNFRMIYGGSPYAFYMDNKMPSFPLKKWERIVENFYAKYQGLAAWQKENYRIVQREGQLINPTGRILKFNKVRSKDGLKYSWPDVCNYPVQSLATADIMPLWMVLCSRELRKYPEIKFCCQVHDDIIFDVPENLVDVCARTCYNIGIGLDKEIEKFFGFPFNVPLKSDCKVGYSWGKMEKYNVAF